MKPRSVMILAALTLGLGAFILLWERDLPSTDERRDQEQKVLLFEPDAVTGLVLGGPGIVSDRADSEARIVFERRESPSPTRNTVGDPADPAVDDAASPDTWWLLEPVEGKADTTAVEGLLDNLTGLRHRRRIEEAIEPGPAGLDPPRARLEILRQGEEPLVLLLGDPLPASSARLAVVEGRPGGFVVETPWIDDLSRSPGDWRDKRLVDIDRSAILRVLFDSAEQRLALARRDDDTFWLEQPVDDQADRPSVDRLLQAVVELKAVSFLDFLDPTDDAERGLDPPVATVEVETEGAPPLVIELGGPVAPSGSVIYARLGGQTVTVARDLLAVGGQPAETWRSTAWTSLQVFDIASAQLSDAEGTVEVARDGVDWRRDGEKIDRLVTTDLLYALVDARGRQVLERERAEALGHRLDEAELTLQLATDGGVETLRLYPALDGLAVATSESRPAVVLLDEETIGDLHEKIAALRAAEPLEAVDGSEETAAEPGDDGTDPAADP